MKKQFVFLLLLLFSSSILIAQVEKGNWYMAGYSNLGLKIGTSKTEYDGTTDENYKYSYFSFSPEAGYFVMNQLVTGLFIDFDRYTTKYDEDKDFDTKIILGPFVRYYITDLKGFWPYAEGRVGFGKEKRSNNYDSEDVEKWSYFTTKLGGGATYFVTKHVGFDVFMGYDYDAWTDKSQNVEHQRVNNSDNESKDKYGSFEMNFGIVISLGK